MGARSQRASRWEGSCRAGHDRRPVLIPLRRIIPPVRMGGAALDLSPLVLLIGLSILSNAICG